MFQGLGDRLDAELLPKLYAAASLPTPTVRAQLREWGLSAATRDGDARAEELDVAARTVISRSVRGATLRGAIAGAAGAMALPPEVVASLVQHLHLAQRLAVIYGHDPDTDRGRLLLARAMAHAYDVELPDQAPADMRVRQLPAVVRTGPGGASTALGWVAEKTASRVTKEVVRRIGRVVPGVGAGLNALGARRRMRTRGNRMADVLRGAWEGAPIGPVEDAVEIVPSASS